MYRTNGSGNRNGGYNRNNNRRGNFSGGRRIKTYDPTPLINAPRSTDVIVEHEIVNGFSDFDISDQLKRNILACAYKTPTPIQDQAIPEILKGRDLIGVANTGTGKTAAFLIPLIDNVLMDRRHRVLIVAPTRELAFQIRDELNKFTRGMHIFSALLIGGANINKQRGELSRNPNFVIGTPGRIKDLSGGRSLRLNSFDSIVLDEADHMVDIGFISDIKYFISQLPQDRLSLFFSATIDGKVKEILSQFVKDPVTISVKKTELLDNIEQKIIKVMDASRKINILQDLLDRKELSKVLVFGRTKRGVQKLSDMLSRNGFKTGAIHGDKRQSQRVRVLENFKRNNINILIATDVASRGLDIPNVSHVINYDLPESRENYTHRIGRTGRAGKRGYALTFMG